MMKVQKAGKSKNRMRILIVEDEEEILSYLKEELEEIGRAHV